MKIYLNLVLLVALSVLSYKSVAQININIPANHSRYDEYKDRSNKINIPDLTLVTDSCYWRLWHNGQAVSYTLDLYKDAAKMDKAFITLFTNEVVDEKKEKPTNRTFFYRVLLNDVIAKKICLIMDSMQINKIPRQDDIPAGALDLMA
jgi:hypothetical protein